LERQDATSIEQLPTPKRLEYIPVNCCLTARRRNLELQRDEEGKKMTKKLAALIERARGLKMSPEHREEQRRSFAYGNTKIENDLITREMVNQLADAQKRKQSRNG
jgi:hypothetical protein